ncbi:methyltransferase 7A [Sigmodon hispidus]
MVVWPQVTFMKERFPEVDYHPHTTLILSAWSTCPTHVHSHKNTLIFNIHSRYKNLLQGDSISQEEASFLCHTQGLRNGGIVKQVSLPSNRNPKSGTFSAMASSRLHFLTIDYEFSMTKEISSCPSWCGDSRHGYHTYLALVSLRPPKSEAVFPKPGGAFYFMEHVADERSTWNYFWQQVLDPAWYLLFDGCNLTRESWKALEQASFSKLKLQHIQAPMPVSLVQPHVYGYAVK